MSYPGNDRYNGGDRGRDRSRGSRDHAALESDYGRLNERGDADWGYGRGRGRSPGRESPLIFHAAACVSVGCVHYLLFALPSIPHTPE